ncbi:MAG: hypothetical protein NTZ80_01005 [Patescibacteria group bacterium]|nr:hypothetical protein [Patescibacteria group bacterium]
MQDNLDQFIPRETAARMLDISVRSLDRLARAGKIVRHKRHGRVFFSLSAAQKMNLGQHNSYVSSPLSVLSSMSTSTIVEPETQSKPVITNTLDRQPDNLAMQLQKDFRVLLEKQEEFQREIIQRFQNDLQGAQKKLEAANYRVGQLETELRNSVPLLESVHKSEQVFELNMKLERLERIVRDEKFSKTLYWLLAICMAGVAIFTLLFW